MTEVSVDAIGAVLSGVLCRSNEELLATPEDRLDVQYWHFRFDAGKSAAANLYRFCGALELYQRSCRRWEEHHGGTCCVVERVRDKFLMPKINAFVNELVPAPDMAAKAKPQDSEDPR